MNKHCLPVSILLCFVYLVTHYLRLVINSPSPGTHQTPSETTPRWLFDFWLMREYYSPSPSLGVQCGAGQSLCSISEAWTIKLWKFNCDNCNINLTHLSPPGVTLLTINGLWISPRTWCSVHIDWISSWQHSSLSNSEARELLCYAPWARTNCQSKC